MKLWLLRPVENHELLDNDPWDPWYDKAFGFVVRAASEAEARALAQSESKAETYDDDYEHTIPVWTVPSLATCVLLTDEGAAGVIISDVWSA